MTLPKNKVLLILYKEWLELRQQRSLILSALGIPLLFTVIPLVFAFIAGTASADSFHGLPTDISQIPIPGISQFKGQELIQALLVTQFATMPLLIPVITTSIIASYSIVGEKTNRTLEPVLATPVTTVELLLAKSLTALIPAVAGTWLSALVYAVGLRFILINPKIWSIAVTPSWIAAILLIAPLLALISTAATVAVSSRVNDPRTAQQISAVIIVPVILIFLGQIAGVLVIGPLFVTLAVVVLGIIAAGVLWLATRLFNRETILTKWT